ncbi:MAG: ABC transporter permease subunit [Armatimonadetes bacterium]|nr:ABC transporter permease subunit [Armatimonadota bacterium]
MPHISVVGRKSLKVRAFILMLYLLLSLGAVTMVLPFMLMLSTSFTSNVDSQDFGLYPRYWSEDIWLYRKFVESEYNEDTKLYSRAVGTDLSDFRDLSVPKGIKAMPKGMSRQVQEYDEFKAVLPINYTLTAHAYSVSRNKTSLEGAFLYRDYLRKEFGDDIQKANEAYGESRDYFDMQMPLESWYMRAFEPAKTQKFDDQWAFKRTLPPRFLIPAPIESTYREYVKSIHNADLKKVAEAYKAPIKSLNDIPVPDSLPSRPGVAKDWEGYMRKECPFQFLVVSSQAQPAFQGFLEKKYHGDLSRFNENYFDQDRSRYYSSWSQIPLPKSPPAEGFPRSDYADFIQLSVSAQWLRLQTPSTLYRDYLLKKYGTVEALNAAYQTSYKKPEGIALPVAESDWYHLAKNKSMIRRQFMTRNYRDVMDYIVFHGRALFNTLVLVFGTILITLTINPMAAYALSRFKLPQTYKILLFCLATMAFPAEVSAIQSFLLLKGFHLLNTYWALFLPGAANGFSIFLLKGFFDGLPQELYEAAEMDGANELTMYTKICFAMSKPVLAVIALGAFGGAYGSFMWALLVCQDKNMWTLMVWLQQMSGWAPMSMVYAALVLAAIPTLLVFIFCQNIIMRGVILPMEK